MNKLLLLTGLLIATPLVASAHNGIEPRIGLRSEAVIRHELKQAGIHPDKITIKGEMAQVEFRVNSKPAILEYDRLGGGTRLLTQDPQIRARILPKLRPSVVIRPGQAQKFNHPLKPRMPGPVERQP